MESRDTIRICTEHDKEVPLISTFAFNGAEFWCPYCGATFGLFGAGEKVEETEKHAETAKHYEAKSVDFLRAMSRRAACEVKWEGKWIKPNELPESEKSRDAIAIAEWQYDAKAEDEQP